MDLGKIIIYLIYQRKKESNTENDVEDREPKVDEIVKPIPDINTNINTNNLSKKEGVCKNG